MRSDTRRIETNRRRKGAEYLFLILSGAFDRVNKRNVGKESCVAFDLANDPMSPMKARKND